jgi:NAD(P)-dependent dehydrogenase (short-subunit alcohol dehydrogenase family)
MTTDRPRALVTGAGRNLGRHVVRRLVADGWHVDGTGRTEPDSFEGDRYLQVDPSSPSCPEQVVAELGAEYSLVVHCASSYPDGTTVGFAEIESTFRVNALVPYELTRQLLLSRTPGAGVTVVCTHSEAMLHADHGSGVYAASKAAFRVLSSALASEFRGGDVAVAGLLLGPLATPDRLQDLGRIAQKFDKPLMEIQKAALRRSNPNLVIDEFIALDPVYDLIATIRQLGVSAHGAMFRLDGGSAGSLI